MLPLSRICISECFLCTGDVPLFTMTKSSDSGWGDSGWDDEGWGDPFADVQPTKPPPTATTKSQTTEESRRLRQEERRKKQEAARQKRAAGIGSRPKLGAKSDWSDYSMCLQLAEYLCVKLWFYFAACCPINVFACNIIYPNILQHTVLCVIRMIIASEWIIYNWNGYF